MTTLTIKTDNKEVINAVRALLNWFKVEFEEREEPYDPEFVAMILESEQQIKEGKTVKYEPGTNLWDMVNSK
ncbi:hypothetical protein SAMN05216327_1066 [Dyadobacter sp. SG02]|uniref:DUF2683 family protein n=1 Tax=Dyadobacter sp. SG02 TaxID=1855291 RepID=UPI0008B5D29B|nr:DUF2683 family protein [Dyadobacter sp. SG02]SEJ08876.1 hypothetical protein SAMN05216327_1066 [Dyadobacter sp. SG02]